MAVERGTLQVVLLTLLHVALWAQLGVLARIYLDKLFQARVCRVVTCTSHGPRVSRVLSHFEVFGSSSDCLLQCI